MKKILIFIALLFMSSAAYAQTLEGGVSFDWCEKSQLERDENIQKIKNIIFGESYVKKHNKKEFRAEYSNFLKDKDHVRHYLDVKDGIKENSTEKLAGFFQAGDKLLVMYAVQYKNDETKVYYFDAMGNLRYIDFRSENYPDFPYYTRQYTVNGQLIGSIYFTDKDTQYVYKPDGNFKGVWFKDTMFNKNGKKILTRSNY